MFNLLESEYDKYKEWNKEHKKTCTLYMNDGAIGGRITYHFTPTGLGAIKEVSCACDHKKLDLTEYDHW